MKNMIKALALVLSLTAGMSAYAEDGPCDRPGLEYCFSEQLVTAMHTDTLHQKVRDLQAAGKEREIGWELVRAMKRGEARPAGESCWLLYIWMRPEWFARDVDRQLPLRDMRVLRFNSTGGKPVSALVEAVREKEELPVIKDPRTPDLKLVHYVLRGTGGSHGIGFSYPQWVHKQVATTLKCPCSAVTSYPNRETARYGIVIGTNEHQYMYSKGWEYGLSGALLK